MPDDKQVTEMAPYDAQVRAAWMSRKLSDGTKLHLGRVDEEQMFVITPTSILPVKVTQEGWQICSDQRQQRATKTRLDWIVPNAGGHTHPLGRAGDIRADLPRGVRWADDPRHPQARLRDKPKASVSHLGSGPR